MVKVHALSRLPRRLLSLIASLAMMAAIVPAVTLLTAAPAGAAANPVQVQTTLEGCRRPVPTPAPAKCTYGNPGDTFTTGDLGKNWAELDFVPHRLTLKNNLGAAQQFSIKLAADNLLGTTLGYDFIKQGWDTTYNTAAAPMFSAGCGTTLVTDENNHEDGIVGGIDTTLTTKVTLTMAKDATCLISYEVRLGLGAHKFSGSSLQTQVLNGDDSSDGQRTVSIPVKEVAPQVATTTANASTNTNFTWAITKSATPTSININSCDPAASEPNVGFTVNYTRTEHSPTGLTVSGTITLKNPSARTLTTHDITDTVTDSDGSGPYSATVADTTITVPPADANGDGTASTTFFVNIPLPIGTLHNSATVTYDDPDQPGHLLSGLTTASTAVTVSVDQTSTNSTADITDTEDFVGAANGLQFKRTSTPAMSAFAASDTFHKNGVTGTGSYSISKIVKATTPGNFDATLRDAVSLTPSNGGSASANDNPATDHADVTIHVTAAKPTITITKDVDVAPTSDATFHFTITSKQDNSKSWPASVTVHAGDTSGTGSAVTVDPSTSGYTVTETPAAGYATPDPFTLDALALCDSATPTINNTRLLGHVTVVKALDGAVAGADTHFTFDVECDNGYSDTLSVNGSGSDSTPDEIATGTACTITENTPLPGGWVFESSVPNDGGAVAKQGDDDNTNTVTVTNQRVLGHIRVQKVISGDVAGAPTDFHFTWSCDNGTYSGTLLVNGAGFDQTGDVIPTGIGCTITENDPGVDWSQSSSPVEGGATSSTENGPDNTVVVTNTRVQGHIRVTKELSGPVADATDTFHFAYTCADGAYTGSLTVTVTNGISKSVQTDDVIPLGVSCTISETDPGADWSLTGTVPENGTATSAGDNSADNTVTFTNTRNLGHVRVDKSLSGAIAGAEHSFTFDVVCASEDQTYSHTFQLTIDPTGATTASTPDEIPTGVTCNATETGNYPHWTLLSVTPDSGNSVSSATDTSDNLVSFVNERVLGHVTVIKTLDGDVAGAETQFTFHVECAGVDQQLLPDLVVDAGNGSASASTADVVPTGESCTVTEVGTYPHWTLESVTPHGEDATVGSADAAEQDGEGNTVVFVNQRLTGVITVDKTRVGNVAGASTVFVFDIVCPDFPAYDQALTIDTADSATATATSNEIPTDVSCTVTERSTDGWQQTQPEVGGVDVVVPGKAEFTNTRLTGPLQLVKSVSPETGSYTPGDPANTLTYTLTLSEPAPGQLDHTNVVVTDYIPGFDPADTTSGKTTYVDGSATCATGCSSSYDPSQHLLTWDVGSYKHDDAPLVMTFKVTIDGPTAAADGAIPAEQIDNVGFVESVQQPKTPSNQVVVPVIAVLGVKIVRPPQPAPQPAPQPQVLPFTGSSLPIRASVYLGGLLIAVGVALSATRRRRRGTEI